MFFGHTAGLVLGCESALDPAEVRASLSGNGYCVDLPRQQILESKGAVSGGYAKSRFASSELLRVLNLERRS